jgi:hypothetical protein
MCPKVGDGLAAMSLVTRLNNAANNRRCPVGARAAAALLSA